MPDAFCRCLDQFGDGIGRRLAQSCVALECGFCNCGIGHDGQAVEIGRKALQLAHGRQQSRRFDETSFRLFRTLPCVLDRCTEILPNLQ